MRGDWMAGDLEELARDDEREGAADVSWFREQDRRALWPMAELVSEEEDSDV